MFAWEAEVGKLEIQIFVQFLIGSLAIRDSMGSENVLEEEKEKDEK